MTGEKYIEKDTKRIVTVMHMGAPMYRPDVVWYLYDGDLIDSENEHCLIEKDFEDKFKLLSEYKQEQKTLNHSIIIESQERYGDLYLNIRENKNQENNKGCEVRFNQETLEDFDKVALQLIYMGEAMLNLGDNNVKVSVNQHPSGVQKFTEELYNILSKYEGEDTTQWVKDRIREDILNFIEKNTRIPRHDIIFDIDSDENNKININFHPKTQAYFYTFL